MKEVWLEQRTQFLALVEEEAVPYLDGPLELGRALEFAEVLTLATNKAAAVKLVREDPIGAAEFANVLCDLTGPMTSAQLLPSDSRLTGPFHEIADFVSEFLAEMRRLSPHQFE